MLDHDIFSELLKSITLGTSNVLKQLLTLSEGTDRGVQSYPARRTFMGLNREDCDERIWTVIETRDTRAG